MPQQKPFNSDDDLGNSAGTMLDERGAVIPYPPTEAEATSSAPASADEEVPPTPPLVKRSGPIPAYLAEGVWAAHSKQILLIAVLFFAVYATTFVFMMKRWASDPAATHGWLVLPIVAIVIWYKRQKLSELPLQPNNKGLWVMGLALFMHLAEKAIDLNGPSPLSIPLFAAGAVWYVGGTQWLKELAFPLGYLLFMIPIPGGLTEVVSFPLRMLATNGSRAIVSKFGIEVAGSGMHMEFMQPNGYEYIRLEVADPCSGLHSVMAIKALHAITAYLSKLKLGWKWVLFMCALPVALAANLCRMVSIILISGYISKDFGLNMWHENIAPYLLFGFAFAILISLGKFMEWATGATKREREATEKHLDAPVAAPVIVRTPRYNLVIGTLAVVFGLSLYFSLRPENISAVADVTTIPRDLPGWKCLGDVKMDDSTMKQILADSYVDRMYQDKNGQLVELLVVYRRFGRREFAHRPELCYPAGGFTITHKGRTTLAYAGHDNPAIQLIADGTNVARADGKVGVPTTTVSYLFASGQKTECDFLKQQIWMAIERLIPNKNGWTFVRLSSMRVTNDEDAARAQQDFMRAYSPSIEKVITTDGVPSSVAQAAPVGPSSGLPAAAAPSNPALSAP